MAMLVCMAVALFSCSKDEEVIISATPADVMGTWTVTSSDIDVKGVEISDQQKALLVLLTEAEGNIFKFEDGGKFVKESKNLLLTTANTDNNSTYTEEGSWQLNGGKTLILTNEDDEKTTYEIRSLNAESATIVEVASESGVTVEVTVTLKK